MSRRSLAAPSLRAGRPVGRRAGRSAPSFSSTSNPTAEDSELIEVVGRLREGLSRIEKERRGMEQGILDLLDPGLCPGPRKPNWAAEQRYRRRLAAELQGANVGLEELVLNLRTVLTKGFRSRFVQRAKTTRQKEPAHHARPATK